MLALGALSGLGIIELSVLLVALFGYILPVYLNVKMARSRGQNVTMIVVLTLLFTWVVTIILALTTPASGKRTA